MGGYDGPRFWLGWQGGGDKVFVQNVGRETVWMTEKEMGG